MASLNVWMNGQLVGEWTSLRSGVPVFRYERAWTESRHARALSLSLPITADREIRGPVVESYFENLLPDSVEIRRRMRATLSARSMSTFDLLSAAGRDCIGAVQLLPLDAAPIGWNRIDAAPLSEAKVEEHLRGVTAPALGQREEGDEFRISIAGAQEKTALLFMGGKWFRPLGATPTTHILKLPLGLVGGFRADFSDSVENEWFCAQVLRELGLPVADSKIISFGDQKVLAVERFDRRWIGVESTAAAKRQFKATSRTWIARLPQEDLCQASGIPPSRRYESDGGPTVEDALRLFSGSAAAEADRSTFVLAQLAFWLLAATDGHGKNFSLHHLSGGAYRMTPLYDVLSAWPIIGSGRSQLPQRKVKLAMSLPGRKRHYKLDEMQVRHWRDLATRAGVAGLWRSMHELAASADAALERVVRALPAKFPERVAAKISRGVRDQARRFLAESQRST